MIKASLWPRELPARNSPRKLNCNQLHAEFWGEVELIENVKSRCAE